MSTLNTTPNRGYEEPFLGNDLSVDVGRLIAALRSIDVDMANALAAIVAKADLASPVFTGVPTAPTAAPGTDTGQLATTAFVRAAVVALIASSPGALDTLNELAAALGNDPNFSTTVLTAIGLKADAAATTAALATKAGLTATNTFTKTQTWAKGADVASASVLTLGTDGNYFDIAGTAAITSIGTLGVGTTVKLHFDAALTLTHHATDLILPGGANITTAAGDEAEFIEYAAGDWRCTNYQPYSSPVSTLWEHIGTQTASAASSVTFTSLSAYRMLRAYVFVTVSADDAVVYAQTSVSGTFDAVVTNYNNQGINGFSTTVNTANSDGMKITSAIGNAGNEAAISEFIVYELNQTRALYYLGDTYCLNNTATAVKTQIGGIKSNTSARDGLRIIPDSGTITGFITLEGVRG